MPPRFKFHHVGLLSADTATSARYYRERLGHRSVARLYAAEEYDLTFLSAGSDLLLELIGQPLSAGEAAFAAARGWRIHHLAFEVADVDAAFKRLQRDGLTAVWQPEAFDFAGQLRGRHGGVLDDCGNVLELIQLEKELAKQPVSSRPFIQLHHANILSDDWRRTRDFYTTHFGLKSVYEHIYPKGGAFLYLADSFFNFGSHNILLEIIGPPYAEAREQAFAARFGTGLDHLGYITADVGAAYAAAVARGVRSVTPPYADFGTTLAWLKDGDGNDLEVMQPLAETAVRQGLAGDGPFRLPV